jgi:hypothetical protein
MACGCRRSLKRFCKDRDSVLRIGEKPARIDLVTALDGVEFDAAWPHRVELWLDRFALGVISAEHLIQNKLKSATLQDLVDLRAIREADRAAREKYE